MLNNETSRAKPTLWTVAILLGLAFILTYPLPFQLATHAPGDGSDDPAILWNLWWVRYSLTELQQSPFQSAWMFYPLGINLVFYTLTTLNGILSIPIQLAFGIVPANSFVIYFELVMAALGMWLFMRWVLAYHREDAPFSRQTRDGLALLAAVIYAYSTSKWLYLSLGQFNIASSHWLPWAVLYLARMWTAPTLKRALREAVLCAFFTLCIGWTEFTYASFFIQFAALFFGWLALSAIKSRNWAKLRQYTIACTFLGLLFVLGMAPIIGLMLEDMRVNGDFLVEGLGFSNIFSNDVLGFFVPGEQHPLFGEWVREGFTFSYLNFAFIGWVTAALVIIALLRRQSRPQAIYWVLFAFIFGVLSLGPTLRLNGQEWDLPMPFDLLLQIPFVKANRYPSRYSVMIMLCVAVAATWGAVALLKWWQTRNTKRTELILAGVGLLVLLEHFGVPLPMSDYRVPPVYEQVRQNASGAVLDIPLAWRNGFRVTGTQHPAFMFAQAYQTYHEKRLLSGNTSRNPELKFQYFTELPVINSIIALETGNALPEGRAERERPIAPELLRLMDAQDIVIQQLDDEIPGYSTENILAYLESVLGLGEWYSDEEYLGLGAFLPLPPEQYEWDARHPLARLFFAEGWSALPPLDSDPAAFPQSVWAEQPEARILLPSIATEGNWTLSFTATVELPSRVSLFAQNPDGGALFALDTLDFRAGTHAYEVPIPASAPRDNLTNLIFRFDGTPAIQQEDTLLVESAALAVGDFAHIYWNGEELGGTETGYHAALFQNGALVAAHHFDTFNDPNASVELASFLNNAEAGTLLALAGADAISAGDGTAGFRLGDEVWEALTSFGATPQSDMRGNYGWSHAFIGVKGDPSQVREDSSAIRPARVFIGAPLHTNTFYARLEGFRLVAR
jgi:hypothetical protein